MIDIKQLRKRRNDARPKLIACGWCKGFVHEEYRDGMVRYYHDERPVTMHEVLPYRVR
jgi:hypothetical protein